MSLRCLNGRSRSLRPQLYKELAEALGQDGGPLIVLVPEQYTLESEREIIEALGIDGSFRLQVMSPARLYSRVFEAAGKPEEVRVDERGRVMLMHTALKNLSRELTWYRGAQHRPGFAELAAGQIKELKQAGYTPEKLDSLAEGLKNGPLKSKMADLSLLWRAYDGAMAGRFMDGEDELMRALERLDRAAFLKDSRIWAHGFELVSPTLAQTLTALAKEHEVSLLLPLESDEAARDFAAFEPVLRTFARLCTMAQEAGVQISRIALTDCAEEDVPGDLAHLRREINCFSPKPYEGISRNIRLKFRKNPMDEAMLAMAAIRDRVMLGTMRWRDAAIACFDLPTYANVLERAAGLYDVPIFMENSRSADRNALAQFVLLALKLVAGGWQTEDVCRIMRTGYCDLTADEADSLSNCAIEQGLRVSLWKKPLHRAQGSEQEKKSEEAEPIRQKLTAPLMAFEEEILAAGSTKAQMTAIWRLLEKIGAYEKLRAFRENCEQNGLLEAANENAQVWNRLLTTMDQLCELMADVHLLAKDVYELMSQSLAASEIRPLPQSGDAVMIGSMSHLRGSGVRMLFVLGCNERHPSSAGGLFQVHEREILGGEEGVWLAPDSGDRTKLAAIDLSAALTLANKYVTFTYAQSDAEGKALLPGAIVGRLKTIFPLLAASDDDEEQKKKKINKEEKMMLNAPDAAFMRLSSELLQGKLNENSRGALAALNRMDELKQPLHKLRKAAGMRAVSEDIDRATAKRLYDGPMQVSVSRLESFASCPFAHFVKYGLKPQELEPYEVNKADEGTFYHEALKEFMDNVDGNPAGMTPEEAIERMDTVSERLLSPMMDGPLGDNPVMLAHSRRMRVIARRAARTITKHLADSGFKPCGVEVSFGGDDAAVKLYTQFGEIAMEGRIDRYDEWTNGDETWLRIIDYKSGKSELKLDKLYFGLQLQLIIYLAVVLQKQDEAHPAGMFYFKVADPLVKNDSRDPDVIEQARTKELRLSGLYINDMQVLEAMSPDLEQTISLSLKADGKPKSSTFMLDEEGFELLIRHAQKKATEIAEGILSGKTLIEPKKMSGFCACDYCHWRAICQQDALLGGMPVAQEKITQKDVLDRIREEIMNSEDD